MARYSTSLDVGKELDSEPVKPMNPPVENEEQVTLDEVPEEDSEEEEFLAQKRAKKAAKAQNILDDEIDDSDEEKTSINYAERFMQMDEETEEVEIEETAPEISNELEKVSSQEEDAVDIINQTRPVQRIQKIEPIKSVQKTKKIETKQVQPSVQEKPQLNEQPIQETIAPRLKWGWIITLILLIIISGIVWKYWSQLELVGFNMLAQPAQMSAEIEPKIKEQAQNLTIQESQKILGDQEVQNADDALAGLSDRLKG